MEELDAIDEAAVTWFARLRDDAADADTHAQHAAWLAADARHRGAWNDIGLLWSGMERPFSDMPVREGEADHILASSALPRHGWRFASRHVARAAMLFLALGGLWTLTPSGLFADQRTAVAEHRSMVLPDGSRVELAAYSALSENFQPQSRNVTLHGGEAYFSVTGNRKRPFRIAVGDGQIMVVGTAFNVKQAADAVTVSVAEGKVDVMAPTGRTVRLTAGQSVRYDGQGIGRPMTMDPANIALWRQDRLVFDNIPLTDVVRDLERYRRGHIMVMGRGVDQIRATGMFDIHRPDAALDTIARTLPVRVVRITPLLVLIYPRV